VVAGVAVSNASSRIPGIVAQRAAAWHADRASPSWRALDRRRPERFPQRAEMRPAVVRRDLRPIA